MEYPPEVIRLINAARTVLFTDDSHTAKQELDEAVTVFEQIVSWPSTVTQKT